MPVDPLSAIGLAANIVQFIDFGGKVLTRLKEFNWKAQEVPEIYRDVKNRLPLLLDCIKRIQKDVDRKALDEETQATLLPVIEGCKIQIEKLYSILDKTLPAPGDKFRNRVDKVSASFWQETKIKDIKAILEAYKGDLILHANYSYSPYRTSEGPSDPPCRSVGQTTGNNIIQQPASGATDTPTDAIPSKSPALRPVSTASERNSPTDTIFSTLSFDTLGTTITVPTPRISVSNGAKVTQDLVDEPFSISEPAVVPTSRALMATMYVTLHSAHHCVY